jgi:hypothetical protein
MSGPCAASYGIEAAVLVSAQSIIQGAAEIAAGMADAERQASELRRQRQEERRRMRNAREAGSAERQGSAENRAAMERFSRLLANAAADETGKPELAERLATLSASGASLQAQLAVFLTVTAAIASFDVATARRVEVARILERIALDPEEPLPPAFEALAQQVIEASTPDRSAALATELRLQVQQHNAARAAALEQMRLQEAAAVVLEQSLKDLGYAVEEIEETLFVEGGIAHFQQPDWGDYFVRLRVDPQRRTMNLNVVRTGTPGDDRKVEDMLAEERWCAAFPKLFDTLKARGIPIEVTRLLQAGEVPVQIVDAASLPVRNEEERRPAAPHRRVMT